MQKKVIFDIDGVLLSEKRYFDVSALAVWEWYYSPLYMHLSDEPVTADLSDRQITKLRARFWKDDEILLWLKSHGVNSNWDMVHAHILTTIWMLLEQYIAAQGPITDLPLQTTADVMRLGKMVRGYTVSDAANVLNRLIDVVPDDADKDGLFDYLGNAVIRSVGPAASQWVKLDSPLWQLHFQCFQEWYFGDDLYERTYKQKPYASGKQGFLQREEPLGTVDGIRHMFRELKKRGYDIAIASGRSQMEMQVPFEAYDWFREFDPRYISTDTDVIAAEQQLHMSLSKPNPFAYYLGAFGKYPEKYKAYIEDPDRFKEGDYYIVGDSLSDVWCAKAMGAVMIGTLTGLEGKAARAMFKTENVNYIIDSVEDVLNILK